MPGRLPQSLIDDILSRVDIVELIRKKVPLKKQGNNFSGTCPSVAHRDKTPSFKVSPDKQFYNCFGCGIHGNAINFVMTFEQLDFREAVEYLAAQVGVDIHDQIGTSQNRAGVSQTQLSYKLLNRVAQYYQKTLTQTPYARAYLKKRGISEDILKRYAVGFAAGGAQQLSLLSRQKKEVLSQLETLGMLIKKEEGGYFDRFRQRIMFPIRDRRGRCLGFGGRVLEEAHPKYLNSPETPLFHKQRVLYGLYEALQQTTGLQLDTMIVVEGYLDVLSLSEQGISNVVATLGTAVTDQHMRQLLRHTQNIVICFDGDEAGQKAAWRALEAALPMLNDGVSIRFIFLKAKQDPDEFVREKGKVAFETLIREAQPLGVFLLASLSKDLDLNQIEARVRLVASFKPFIQKLPQGLYRDMLIDQLADRVNMQRDRIERRLSENTSQTISNPISLDSSADSSGKSDHTTQQGSGYTAAALALSLLLQKPELSQSIDRILDPVIGASEPFVSSEGDTQLLIEVFEALKARKTADRPLSTGMLMSWYRDHPLSDHIQRLAVYPPLLPDDQWSDEFQQLVQRVQWDYQQAYIKFLLKKLKEAGLSAKEKKRLQALISRQKKS